MVKIDSVDQARDQFKVGSQHGTRHTHGEAEGMMKKTAKCVYVDN